MFIIPAEVNRQLCTSVPVFNSGKDFFFFDWNLHAVKY